MKKPLKVFFVTVAVVLGVGVGSSLALVFIQGFLESRVDTPAVSTTTTAPTYTPEELLTETNTHRASPLTLDPVLNSTAQRKCEDMAQRNDFNHGDLESYWIMSGRREHGLAENLAHSDESAERIVDSWVASPTHYANIIDTKWGHVGFGICPFRGSNLIVQHFSD
jgi:uncharacterized protein YkwD